MIKEKAKRSVVDGKLKLLSATMLGVDAIIDVLKRPIDPELDDDKIKAAVDAKSQSVKSVKSTLIYIDSSGSNDAFILEKIDSLVDACWKCFDIITEIIPLSIQDDLEDNRMKNAIVAKDVGRDTCAEILETIEEMQNMLDSGEVTLRKTAYRVKTIESIAKNTR